MNMRISLLNRIKYPLGILATVGALGAVPIASTAKTNTQKIAQTVSTDHFEKTLSGLITDSKILGKAPTPEIEIQGKKKLATLVVDIKNNILYRYNEAGQAIEAYKTACGAAKTPTPKGISIVTDIQDYPYSTLSPATKRYKNPDDYGPNILELKSVNPETGAIVDNGIFIHGTKNPYAIGKKVTHGCVRVHNKDIMYLVTKIKIGQYVHFIK